MEIVLNLGGIHTGFMIWYVWGQHFSYRGLIKYDFFFFFLRVMSVSKQFIIIDLFGKITLSFSPTDGLFRLSQTGTRLLTSTVQQIGLQFCFIPD